MSDAEALLERELRLDFASLRRAYRSGDATPLDVVEHVLGAIGDAPVPGIWIHRRDADELRGEARSLAQHAPEAARPLYGVPFAVKDSIDVAGVPTTVACPGYAYVPERTAPVVDRLRAAGALFVGKVNLDQLATGLVGVRSPYGVPPNPFDAAYVTGGSSSGSAAAVTRGQVAFALATDTAGSGRVPAAFNNVVGLKPSRGLLSTRGLVPACRSVDCITAIALTCEDARDVAAVATGFDVEDPFSRPEAGRFEWRAPDTGRAVLAVPRVQDLWFGDAAAETAFTTACGKLEELGHTLVRVDATAFFEAGRLLYGGPWISERLASLEPFVAAHPDALLPVLQTILADGRRYSATDAFRAVHRLAELQRATAPLWEKVDALVVPTAPMHPRIADVQADPLALNVRLGLYTTFANLLDLCGVAVPAGMRPDGLPTGITLLGPWGRDAALLALASRVHRATSTSLGATGWPLPAADAIAARSTRRLSIAVVGAHLTGQPLNRELTDRGGRLERATRTAPQYRLYALANTVPPKPGLVRVPPGEGSSVAIEVWSLPTENVGAFLAGVGPPMAIGTLEAEDGERVHGFLCEPWAITGARDITSYGGWVGYLRSKPR